jgi:hypothetical protein
MTQLGVEFKPDLCEKVLQPHEYKKHIASGVIQRPHRCCTLQLHLQQVPRKADDL